MTTKEFRILALKISRGFLIILIFASLFLFLSIETYSLLKPMISSFVETYQKLEDMIPRWLLITICVSSPILGIIFIFIRWKKFKLNLSDLTSKLSTRGKYPKWLKTLLSFTAIHSLLALFFHTEEWYERYVWNPWIIFFQVSFILALTFMRKEVTSKRDKTSLTLELTGLGLIFLILLSAGTFYKVWWEQPEGISQPEIEAVEKPSPLPEYNSGGEKEAREFWKEHATKSPEDFELMVETILPRESNFNHFEKDGVTPLTGRENPSDVGLHQINMDSWKREVSKYPDREVEILGESVKLTEIDPLTEEGNYLAALYLYNQRGLEPWSASLAKGSLGSGNGVIIIIAPTTPKEQSDYYKEWSKPFYPQYKFSWGQIGERKTQIRIDGARVMTWDPKNKKPIHLGKVHSLEFRSLEEEPAKFKIEFH